MTDEEDAAAIGRKLKAAITKNPQTAVIVAFIAGFVLRSLFA